MALIELKTDLGWYGKHQQSNLLKTADSGYMPTDNVTNTRFRINRDLSVSTDVGGFDNTGFFSIKTERTSRNAFLINDYTSYGIASRKAQLGSGTKLPISPQGNIHDMVPVRTGHYSSKKYGDLIGVRYGTAGLANTYTQDSPIDDMYNKFKVREEAFNPFGADKNNGEPYILRGIQRNGKTSPQYWGLGDADIGARIAVAGTNIPRGGMVVYADRYDTDLNRLNKWRQSPHGKAFAIKQAALNMFNPKLTGNLPNVAKAAAALGIVTTYESAQMKAYDANANTNRLVLLKRELLNTAFGSPIGFNGGFVGQMSNILSGGFDNPLGNLFSRATNTTPSQAAQQFSYSTPFASSQNNDPGSHGGEGRNASLTRRGGFKSPPNEYATTKGRSKGKAGFCTSKDYKTVPWQNMPNRATSCNPKTWNFLTQSDYQKDTAGKLANKSYDDGKYVRDPNWPHNRQQGGQFNAGGSNKPSGQQWKFTALDYKQLTSGATQKDSHKSPGGKVKTGGYKGQSDYMAPGSPSFSPSGYSGKDGFQKRWDLDADPVKNYGKGDGMELKFKTDAVDEIKFKIYLTGLSEGYEASWNGEPDQGRADSRYLYEGFERQVNLSFIANGGDTCKGFGSVWKAIQDLARMTLPVYENGSGFRGQLAEFSLGMADKGLYWECPCIITSIGYDWDPSEGTWEIDEYAMPMRTAVDMTMIILGDQKTGKKGYRIQPNTGGVKEYQVFGKDLSSEPSCPEGGGGGGNG